MTNTLTEAKAVPPPFELPEFNVPLGEMCELSRINRPIKLNIRLSALCRCSEVVRKEQSPLQVSVAAACR